MALVKKDAVLQLRLPGELLDDFREFCERERNCTVSHDLRAYMEWQVKKAREAGKLAAVEVAAAPVAAKAPVPAAVDLDEHETRAQRRERERRERKAKA